MGKLSFDDFIATVEDDIKGFVIELDKKLTETGCKIEIKEAKSGYLVSYIYNKKTLFNYVFRKKGMLARIYGNNIMSYMELLDTLPNKMRETIKAASPCKRLINPEDCNSKCAMGYDFIMNGERHQKCRNSAFMFLLCEENNPFIETIIKKEIEARS